MPKFQSLSDYHAWCDDMINTIYYASIAMNDQAIRDTIAKIAAVLHVPDHDTLIASAEEEAQG